MTLLLLVACESPPLVDPVERALAEEVLGRAETPLRLFVAISSVIAEACGVEDLEAYTFNGGGARALNITDVTVTADTSGDVWTFDSAGLADVGGGQLEFSTTTDRGSFDVVYYSSVGIVVSGSIPVIECDVTDIDPTDVVELEGDVATSGTLDFTADSSTTRVLAEGDQPFAGLHFSPPTAPTPTAGWAKWSDDSDDASRGQSLVLESAENIDEDGRMWPGLAAGIASNGVEWGRDVEVKLP